MTWLELSHTAELAPASLAAARDLLDQAFSGEMTDADWDHALGGVHALVWDDDDLIAHASLVQRQLIHEGRALRTGYVEAVATRPDRRRQGHASTVMLAIERYIRLAYDLGALGSTEDGAGFYEGRGWTRWQGPTHALTPHGTIRTAEEDGYIYVLQPTPPLDPTTALTCDYREGDLW